MTDITHDETRDALPDLLHGTLERSKRDAVEKHLASCAECAAELELLRMAKAAPSFAPMIDAARIASVIPPYSRILPETVRQRPSRYWQLATAAAAVVVLVVGALVLSRTGTPGGVSPEQSRVASAPSGQPILKSIPEKGPAPAPVVVPSVRVEAKNIRAPKPNELQLATGLEGVPDARVAQLLRELDKLDGLPSPDPEPLGVGDAVNGPGGEGGL